MISIGRSHKDVCNNWGTIADELEEFELFVGFIELDIKLHF